MYFDILPVFIDVEVGHPKLKDEIGTQTNLEKKFKSF